MSDIIAPETRRVPKVTAVHPFGSTVLIEVLRPDEELGTDLFVSSNTKNDTAPQAYIVELGPKVDPGLGVKVGSRVVVMGAHVPVVNTTNNGRVRGIIEIHSIKAVVEEG